MVVDTQIHGYLRGHQLLSSSVVLSKGDQSVIDRLSDVAGPLRPNESIKPYLAGYPLPSGDYYVLARTWQDLTVARAGCVRTLSLVIPASEWARANSLALFLDLLDPSVFPQTGEAACHNVSISKKVLPIAPVLDFAGGELLEALFLEETKPVVVFGALEPELIATRLITAMWADFGRSSLSRHSSALHVGSRGDSLTLCLRRRMPVRSLRIGQGVGSTGLRTT